MQNPETMPTRQHLADEGLILRPQLAAEIGVSEQTIALWEKTGLPVLKVGAGKAVRRDGFFIAPAELRSRREDGRDVLHARTEVVLASALPAAPAAREAPLLPAYPHRPNEVYRDGLLFHGPALGDVFDDGEKIGRISVSPRDAESSRGDKGSAAALRIAGKRMGIHVI